MMMEHDCGEIPVCDQEDKPIGAITDRDITCRTVAQGKNPLEMTAGDVMSSPCVTVTEETSLEECCDVMEDHQIRRVPVLDRQGRCCGIVAQADVARRAEGVQTVELVREVSS